MSTEYFQDHWVCDYKKIDVTVESVEGRLPEFKLTFAMPDDFDKSKDFNGCRYEVRNRWDSTYALITFNASKTTPAAYYYQSVCDNNRGNPAYALGQYKSGWSSRASVINKVYNKNLVETGMPGIGLDLWIALRAISSNWSGLVMVWVDLSEYDRSIHIMPVIPVTEAQDGAFEKTGKGPYFMAHTDNPYFAATLSRHVEYEFASLEARERGM